LEQDILSFVDEGDKLFVHWQFFPSIFWSSWNIHDLSLDDDQKCDSFEIIKKFCAYFGCSSFGHMSNS
jgi:hypothetical protein